MLTYYHLWQMNPTEARRILVKDYEETKSYSQTAKNFRTHRRIVRKWAARYQEKKEAGLESLPPIPKSRPLPLDPQLERLILHLQNPLGFRPKRLHYWLKRNTQIEMATPTIAKCRHKDKRTKKHLKREPHKNFGWKAPPLFPVSQVDTKEIVDSDAFTQKEEGPYKRLGLPLYQFTAIFPRTRARFISFSSLNSLEYVFSLLESHALPSRRPSTYRPIGERNTEAIRPEA